jgi:hypothetical protein
MVCVTEAWTGPPSSASRSHVAPLPADPKVSSNIVPDMQLQQLTVEALASDGEVQSQPVALPCPLPSSFLPPVLCFLPSVPLALSSANYG